MEQLSSSTLVIGRCTRSKNSLTFYFQIMTHISLSPEILSKDRSVATGSTCLCGSLNENVLHRSMGSDTSRCGLLEEVCHWGAL